MFYCLSSDQAVQAENTDVIAVFDFKINYWTCKRNREISCIIYRFRKNEMKIVLFCVFLLFFWSSLFEKVKYNSNLADGKNRK